MAHGRTALALAVCALFTTGTFAQDAATVGSAGSASAGATSASTIGTAGTSTDAAGNASSSIGSSGSAAAAGGNARSKTNIVENPNGLKANSKAMANDGGTFSKSMTKTKVKNGELSSDTKTMSHVPGEKPVKSTSGAESTLLQ